MTRVAIYSMTMPGRGDLLRRSFRELGRMAGYDFHHYVWDQGSLDSDKETSDYLAKAKAEGHIHWLRLHDHNVGQQIAANFLLDEIEKSPTSYDWILRWDPDAMPRSRRFLRKMVKVGDFLLEKGVFTVLSPKIQKLAKPPPALKSSDDIVIGGRRYNYDVVQILGGICRLHPRETFVDWRFNQFLPKGLGEAYEVANRVTDLAKAMNGHWSMVRLTDLKVEHRFGSKGQEKRYPEYFGMEWEFGRYASYGL